MREAQSALIKKIKSLCDQHKHSEAISLTNEIENQRIARTVY